MHRIKLIRAFIALALIVMASIVPPAKAASDHQNGQIRVRWNPIDIYLNQNSYIEHEFIPTATTSFVDGAPFRWANQYHFDFCWGGTTAGRCGYVGFGLGSKNGDKYYGNFDFAIFNAVAFSTTKTEPNVTCSNSANSGFIGDTQTYYMNCWKGVTIQMGTPYVLRVQWDPSNTPTDNNWWSATLTNKSTNETMTIGKIKAYGNFIDQQLLIFETVIFYGGDAVACDKVPIMDLRVSPPKSNTRTGQYLNYWNASCIRAKAFQSKEFPGYYSIRLGGENPESRELVNSNQASASPSNGATSTIPKEKPSAPVFTGINISNNTLNINVNLNSSEPDLVYLVAPKLTGGLQQKFMADIDGNSAKWAIKFDPKNLTEIIPLSFYSVKSGLTSSETKVDFKLPSKNSNSQTINKAPESPTNVSSKLAGKELIVTAKVVTTGVASANSVILYSNSLNIKRDKPLIGNLVNNSVVFSIPVTSSDLSKKIEFNLVATNKVGSSKVTKGSFSLVAPKSPVVVKNENVATVICAKGQTVRTFASKICPPGWETK